MQKVKVVCLILATVLASVGTVAVVQNMGDSAAPPVIPQDSVNTTLEKPSEGSPSSYDAKQNLFIAAGELQRSGGFVGESYGSTTSAGITQEVLNKRTVVGGNVFKQMSTCSSLVKNAYQVYLYGDSYLYRKANKIKDINAIEWDSTAQNFGKEGFLNKFGHRSDSLSGYILNEETVTSGEFVKEENGLFTYRYSLDIEKAPAYMLYEMRANSNMDGYSTFVRADIIVTMDSDWQVKTLTTDCEYKVPLFGGIKCKEDITETFTQIGYNDDLPEKEFFEQFFNAQIKNPIDAQPDALSVLMKIFEPYISGDKLNLSLVASYGEKILVDGLISAKIDIENVENIALDVKLGSDLYLNYNAGKLYVSYQEFKGSTTVDGIMSLLGGFLPQASAEGGQNDSDFVTELISKFSLKIENDLCTVNLPVELDGAVLNVNIYANVKEGGYEFTSAEATFGDIKVELKPVAAWNAPEISGDYPEILGLLDFVKDGAICANVNVAGLAIDVQFDLASKSLYAMCGDMSVVLRDNVAYLTYGEVKLKLDLDDAEQLITLISLFADGGFSFDLPDLSVDSVLEILSDVKAVATDSGVRFEIGFGATSVTVDLTTNTNGWNLSKINVAVNEISAEIVPIEKFGEIPQIEAGEYADVTEIVNEFAAPVLALIKGENYAADFDLSLRLDNKNYNVKGTLVLDGAGNVQVDAKVFVGGIAVVNANIIVADGTVFADVNGVKAAFKIGDSEIDLTGAVNALKGADENIDGIIDRITSVAAKLQNLDLSNLDFAAIIKEFGYSDGTLNIVLNAESLGLGDIGLKLGVSYGNLRAEVYDLTLGGASANLVATVKTNLQSVEIPNVSDYVLKLAGTAFGARFTVAADFVSMNVDAEVEYCGVTVLARYFDGNIYVKAGEIKLSCKAEDLGTLINEILPLLGSQSTSSLPLDLSGVKLDVKSILDGLTFDLNSDNPNVSLMLGNIAVALNFHSDFSFNNITVKIADNEIVVEQTAQQAEQLDLTDDYVDMASVARQLLGIYNSFKNVLQTGLTADVETVAVINGKSYVVNAAARYNGGLQVTATVALDGKILVNAEIYLVGNTLYADVNGIRLATQTSAQSGSLNGNQVDFSTIIGALNQIKGYNNVLDSVIDVITDFPSKLENIDYSKLVNSFSCVNGELRLGINGSLLGLSDFVVSLNGGSGVMFDIQNLSVGGVNIDSLSMNAQPSCAKVDAPAEEYVTELQLGVMGITVNVKLDLLNQTVEANSVLLGTKLNALYKQGRVYVTYGNVNAVLDVADIGNLISVVSKFVKFDFPFDFSNVDLGKVLNSAAVVNVQNGYSLKLQIEEMAVTVSFDENAKLIGANAVLGDWDIRVGLTSGIYYDSIDTTGSFVNIADLLDAFEQQITDLLNAEGYALDLKGEFDFGGYVYGVQAEVVYHGGLYVNANLTFNKRQAINAEIWLVNDTLYLSAGQLKFAVNVANGNSSSAEKKNVLDALNGLKGYNSHVDALLSLVIDIVDKFQNNSIDYVALVGGLTFEDAILRVNVNGSQLGLSDFDLQVRSDGTLTVALQGLAYQNMRAGLTASASPSNTAVDEPQGDFTTNLSIKIDDKNTVYANLDILNGVYNLKLGELNVTYCNNVVKINYENIYVTGDVAQILDMIKRIDDLVNEFSGADKKDGNGGLDIVSMIGNVDLKQIVRSVSIFDSSDGTVTLNLKAFGMTVSVKLANGELTSVTIPVEQLNKTLEIKPTEKQSYFEFPSENDVAYVSIEQIFNDYFPTIEQLVHTNCWQFVFNNDAVISVGQTMYKLTAGSYFEFYYNKTQSQDFKLRAGITLQKFENNVWKEFISVDVAYIDGEIFVTYNEKLKITLSTASIKECAGLLPELERVIPQIKTLIDNMKAALNEAQNNAAEIDFSTILRDISYNDGVFRFVINGKVFLSGLGDVALTVSKSGDAISLDELTLSYGNVSVNVNGFAVSPSAKSVNNGVTEYECVNHILSYDKTNHIDLNSIYELLSAFIKTADKKTIDPATGKELRSFNLSGSAVVDAKIKKVNLGLFAQVDINEDGKSFVTVKISRDKIGSAVDLANMAFDDRGGDSYLYFDGVNETVTIIRNSYIKKTVYWEEEETYYYCTKHNVETWSKDYCQRCVITSKYIEARTRIVQKSDNGVYMDERNYVAENLTTRQFAENLMDYILEMVNFSGMIKDQITKPQENTNEYGIEDIVKAYSYDENGSAFKATADLSPISSALGTLNISILHDQDFNLTKLSGDIGLVSIMNASVNIDLLTPVYGDATRYVTQTIYW